MRLVVLFLSITGLLLSGCGGGDQDDDPQPQASSPPPTTDDALLRADRRPVAERCVEQRLAEAREVTFDNADGVELWAAEMGSGPRGVVLFHGTGSSALCNWASVIPALADDGFHVLAVDHNCMGGSACGERPENEALDLDVIAAVDELRRRGARTVTTIGESRGGAVVLAAAARPDFHGDAVVPVSGVAFPDIYSGPRPAPLGELVSRIDVPSLYLASHDDPTVAVPQYQRWAAATPDSRVRIYESAEHGAAMFGHPVGPRYTRVLLPFLRSVSR